MTNIDENIIACLFGEELSLEQYKAVEQWRLSSRENSKLYLHLENMIDQAKILKKGDLLVEDQAYQSIFKKIVRVETAKRRRRQLIGYVAVACVATLVGLFIIKPYSVEDKVGMEQIQPGSPKAELTLASGENIFLEECQGEVIFQDSILIENKDNTLVYSSDQGKMKKEAFNTLKTPLGAEYKLLLEDGTKVYLNSGSKLHYPVQFSGKSREVYLEGEAFFKVAESTTKTFVVHIGSLDIRVLGTSFNVKGYTDQNSISTTLIEGEIEVVYDNQCYKILPGSMAVYDKERSNITIKEVDTEMYSSWKDGYYKFEQLSLEEIMSTLSIWYDLDVFYQDPTKKKVEFTGQLRRYDNVVELLNKFEETREVKFIVKGKQVQIK